MKRYELGISYNASGVIEIEANSEDFVDADEMDIDDITEVEE